MVPEFSICCGLRAKCYERGLCRLGAQFPWTLVRLCLVPICDVLNEKLYCPEITDII